MFGFEIKTLLLKDTSMLNQYLTSMYTFYVAFIGFCAGLDWLI